MTDNVWCEAAQIPVPDLAEVARRKAPSHFRLMVVALLQRGAPMTLAEVAARFAEAGIDDAEAALGSLQRCRPATPPVVRDGDRYGIDPYHDELKTLIFRLGLEPPRAARGAAGEGVGADPAASHVSVAEAVARRARGAAEDARRRRVVLTAFPPARPEAVALLDVQRRELMTFVGPELSAVPERLATFDVIAAVDVRGLLRALGFDPEARRLAELAPAKKTKRLNRQGRTLKITLALLVQGSCGISRPFGEPEKLAAYLASGDHTKLRRRLEADVKSLYALYAYGELHGCVRLRWGFLDESVPAPWAQVERMGLHRLMALALERDEGLEVVVGAAPGWEQPWARARRAFVKQGGLGWGTYLVDEEAVFIDKFEVQAARIAGE